MKNKTPFVVILIFTMAAFLTACIEFAGREPMTNSTTDGFSSGDLQATIWISRSDYYQGEVVEMEFVLVNASSQEVVLEHSDGPAVDIVILGDTALHWSKGPGAGQDLSRIVLQPDETFTITWSVLSLKKGGYLVDGIWWLFGRESNIGTTIGYDVIN